jgi:hypothetical protein
MSNADLGYNTRFAIEDSPGSGVFVELAEVYSVTPPEPTINNVDATHYQSPGRSKEYIAGLTDNGTAQAEMNFVPNSATDQRLETLRGSGVVLAMRITYPNGVTVTFSGFLASYAKAIPVEERMTATAGFRVSGQIVINAGVAPANTLLPAVSGTAQQGQTVTAINGNWTGSPTFTYQWQELITATWTNIAGATAQTLVVPGGSTIGRALRVRVTGTNAAGSATANSAATANVVVA